MAGLSRSVMGRFGKPQLVRETSKLHTNNYLMIPYLQMRKFYNLSIKRRSQDQLFKGIMFDERLEEQLREISYAILNRQQHYAPTKNMLFYGPPGTGKTLFAKKLAQESGLEYAVMVGSDIAPLGTKSVGELNSLFDWAEKQSKGMILFIDEADAFLRSRQQEDMSDYLRHTVNAFLYRTGSPSDRVIVVLATNNPEHLDQAVHDRIDEVVNFTRPSFDERRGMLIHYLMAYSTEPATFAEKASFAYKHPRSLWHTKKLVKRADDFNLELIDEIANLTEGFSGRELTKMVVAWHDSAFAKPDAILTRPLMLKVLEKFKMQHKLKETWTESEARIFGKILTVDTDTMTGTGKSGKKDADMVKRQQELMGQINESRLDIGKRETEAMLEENEAQSAAEESAKTKAKKKSK